MMALAQKKYLDDMKQRLEVNPKTVNFRMLINAIAREIPSKLIPLFVKQEICRHLGEIHEFLKEHEWARKELKQDLLGLFEVVKDVKENHEGFVRVQYAKFRNRVAQVQAKTLPPRLIEMVAEYEDKLSERRHGEKRIQETLQCPHDSQNWLEALKQRCADFHKIPLLQYSSAGMRIRGSIHEELDIPGIVGELNILMNLLENTRTLAVEKIGSSYIQAVHSALDTVPILLKMDGVWLAGCPKIKQLLTDLNLQIQNDPENICPAVREMLGVTIPIIRKCKHWFKIDELAEVELKKKTDKLRVTPEDMMIQTKNLLFNYSHYGCI